MLISGTMPETLIVNKVYELAGGSRFLMFLGEYNNKLHFLKEGKVFRTEFCSKSLSYQYYNGKRFYISDIYTHQEKVYIGTYHGNINTWETTLAIQTLEKDIDTLRFNKNDERFNENYDERMSTAKKDLEYFKVKLDEERK